MSLVDSLQVESLGPAASCSGLGQIAKLLKVHLQKTIGVGSFVEVRIKGRVDEQLASVGSDRNCNVCTGAKGGCSTKPFQDD
jgi:hypothetical protein